MSHDVSSRVMSGAEGSMATPIWKGRLTFIMAASGSAVGLGNIWKFPYVTGENGGGAFFLVYLFCVVGFGIPLLMAEIGIGRATRKNALDAYGDLSQRAGRHSAWRWTGGVAILTSFLVLSFYTVVAGWCLYYFWLTVTGEFSAADRITQSFTSQTFDHLLSAPTLLIIFGSLFLLATYMIVRAGIQGGIEKAINWLMPMLLVVLLILVGYSISHGSFSEAAKFLFFPDFSKLSLNAILVAIGHAFFTLSLASGSMVTYGAYMPSHASIPKTAIMVAVIDTLVALAAGLAIFPLVMEYGLAPNAGPGLIFMSLPLVFGHIPFGQIFGAAFFFMLFIAALTTSISLMEPSVAWLEQKSRLSRTQAATVIVALLWLLSTAAALSFNLWNAPVFADRTLFDALDGLTANIMMPLGGLATALFCGFCLKGTQLRDMFGDSPIIKPFRISVRCIVPCFIVIMIIASL